MFEEVPRERSRYARVLARRVVLGPFVIGTGVLLAAVGGSVAVAATVITASNGGFSDIPPRLLGHSAAPLISRPPAPAAHSSAHRVAAGPLAASTGAASSGSPVRTVQAAPTAAGLRTSTGPVLTGPVLKVPAAGPATAESSGAGPVQVPASSAASPGLAGPVASSSWASAAPSSPASSPAQDAPIGNALIHVSGYDTGAGRIQYQFAILQPATAGGSRVYQVSGPATFSAAIAATVRISSGGTICPASPTGCTPAQLISAAPAGFFAEVAIDSGGQLQSVLEVGDSSAEARIGPAPRRSPAPSPSSSGSPAGPANPAASAPSAQPISGS